MDLLNILFGKELNTSYSEQTILKCLEFKLEQERTKQQFYKLENLNKSLEIYKLMHGCTPTTTTAPPPKPYKFPPENNRVSKRTSSPAKIGSRGVVQLNQKLSLHETGLEDEDETLTPITINQTTNGYDSFKQSPLQAHKRNLSLPSLNKLYIPDTTQSPTTITASAQSPTGPLRKHHPYSRGRSHTRSQSTTIDLNEIIRRTNL
ncbi:hypothetical protein TBLA_0B05880 [Henningerozyma blattae CBS 6284]|uniref:Uncharacterized protein n=1 Tax=Henningerozyma blattae (strain ATCC 34711 / CBS 6284 / DSM 70876 / NBRC 10599 / NRRL Y-10934 / UCD 77-7) TaxID=1071380 RepID=I2GZ62_HENB6|nr:hypothetical protein TBLA_0B05880 [Tetrapisispora blattae CBS 6284]CCH59414.1 hypothetical protein TBLA_0B05880 [Tetrapisispora blattae CBS 6284]